MFAAFLKSEPTEVETPFKLVKQPFDVKIVSEGVERQVSGYACCVPMEVSCGGVSKEALFEHPPPSGRTEASFLLRLPDRPVALKTSVGIRDGSLS